MQLMNWDCSMRCVFVQKRQKKCHWDFQLGLKSFVSKDIDDMRRGFGIEDNNYSELLMTKMLLQVFDQSTSFAIMSNQLLFVAFLGSNYYCCC